jgi:hypothetical protein
MKNIFTGCHVFSDTETGFAYAGKTEQENLFQVCLMRRKDDTGYKKEIKESDSGYSEGICGDYNENLYDDAIHDVFVNFIKLARSSGIKIS